MASWIWFSRPKVSDTETNVETALAGENNYNNPLGNQALLVDVNLAGEKQSNATALQLASDGHAILIPQPSEDPNDPLNWSSAKKHMILFIVAFSAFLGDFGSGAGIPCTILQGRDWDMLPATVNYAGNLNVVMLGVGGIFWIPFIYFWGRAPVVFWTTFTGTLFTLGCALSPDFETFYGLRAMMGFTLTCCQTVGLSFVKDMFFFHQHARKIGLWAALFLIAPYCGPLFGNFIINGTRDWRPVFWLIFAIGCLDLVLILLFFDESWYRRDIPVAEQPDRGTRLMRVLGVWQIQNHRSYFLTVFQACGRLTTVLFKPIIIPTMIYYAMSFMWAVGINITSSLLLSTPVADGGYGFGTKAVGFLYFTPVVGICLGEFFGHWFNDFIVARYLHRHDGIFQPEARLVSNFLAPLFMIPGLVIVGQSLEQHWPYGTIIVGWGMYVFGVMVASVAITAYALDSYPTGAGEVSGLLNLARTMAGFSVGYFQAPWGNKQGYGTSFGIQAAVIAAAVLILIVLRVFGRRMREKGGSLEI